MEGGSRECLCLDVGVILQFNSSLALDTLSCCVDNYPLSTIFVFMLSSMCLVLLLIWYLILSKLPSFQPPKHCFAVSTNANPTEEEMDTTICVLEDRITISHTGDGGHAEHTEIFDSIPGWKSDESSFSLYTHHGKKSIEHKFYTPYGREIADVLKRRVTEVVASRKKRS